MKIRFANISKVFPDKNTVWVEGEFFGVFQATEEEQLKVLEYIDSKLIKDYLLKQMLTGEVNND